MNIEANSLTEEEKINEYNLENSIKDPNNLDNSENELDIDIKEENINKDKKRKIVQFFNENKLMEKESGLKYYYELSKKESEKILNSKNIATENKLKRLLDIPKNWLYNFGPNHSFDFMIYKLQNLKKKPDISKLINDLKDYHKNKINSSEFDEIYISKNINLLETNNKQYKSNIDIQKINPKIDHIPTPQELEEQRLKRFKNANINFKKNKKK